MFLLFLIKNVSFGEDERRCAIVAATKEKGREADQQGMTSKLQYTVDRHA
jgi:hypothetical protein